MTQYHDEHENEYDIRVNGGDLRVIGISRDAENAKGLLLSLTREPTDDEMRALHDVVRQFRYTVAPEPSHD